MRKVYKSKPSNALNESFDSQLMRQYASEHGGVMKRNLRTSDMVRNLSTFKNLRDYTYIYIEIFENHKSDIQLDKITDNMIFGFYTEPSEIFNRLCRRENSKSPFSIIRRMSGMALRSYDADTKTNTDNEIYPDTNIYKFKCILFNDFSFVVLKPSTESYQLQYNAQIVTKTRRERKAGDLLAQKEEIARRKQYIDDKQKEWDGIFNEMFNAPLKESVETPCELRFEPGTVMDKYAELDNFIAEYGIDKAFRNEPFWTNNLVYLTRRNMMDPARFILLFVENWTDKHIADCCGFRTNPGSGILDFIFVGENEDPDYIIDDNHEEEMASSEDEFLAHLERNKEHWKNGEEFEGLEEGEGVENEYKPEDFNLNAAPYDMVEYVLNNVEDFGPRYYLAWKTIGRMRCPLQHADSTLYDAISDAICDWCSDNEEDPDEFDIEEIFG